MKNRTKLFGIYLPIFLSVILGTVAMRTVACLLDFNFHTNFFVNDVLITISDYTVLISVLFFFTYMYTARKDIRLIPNFTSPTTFIPTGLISVALPFVSRHLFSKAAVISKIIKNQVLSSQEIRSYRIQLLLIYTTAVLAILSIAHFALTALIEKRSSIGRAGFGICSVIFLAFYATFLYFDTDLPLNSPNKIIDQMAYLFSALFFLYETRLSLGREKWQHYIAFGFIASTLTAYSSIPSLIVYITQGQVISNSIYETVLTLALFVFITARCLLTGELIEDADSETVSALIKIAEERSEALKPGDQHPEATAEADDTEIEEDKNQITIDDLISIPESEEEEEIIISENSEQEMPEQESEGSLLPTENTENDAENEDKSNQDNEDDGTPV